MNSYTRLQVIFEGNILEVYLDRPEKRNAIDGDMAFELMDIFSHAAANNDVRVLILRGKGAAFCAGADLDYMGREDLTGEDRQGNVFAKLFHALYRFPKPLVVITHGKAMGGALGLVAAADFALATTDAEFAFSEVRIGLVPATISPYIVKRTGERNARQLMLLGDTFSTERALQAGLIDKAGDPGELENYKSYLCRQFEQNAPQAMMTCKRTLQHVSDARLNDETISYTLNILDNVRENPEAREGIRAFKEKRKASWQK